MAKRKTGKIVDQARLKNNVYEGDEDELAHQKSAILKSLESAESVEDAYNTYLGLREFNGNNPIFFLDAFSYFKDRDKEKAVRVVSNLWEKGSKNVELLKLVSMAFAEIGDYENVIRVNEHSLDIVPGDVNAYLNRAMAMKASGHYQEALDEFIALLNGTFQGPNSSCNSSIPKNAFSIGNIPPPILGNGCKTKFKKIIDWWNSNSMAR